MPNKPPPINLGLHYGLNATIQGMAASVEVLSGAIKEQLAKAGIAWDDVAWMHEVFKADKAPKPGEIAEVDVWGSDDV